MLAIQCFLALILLYTVYKELTITFDMVNSQTAEDFTKKLINQNQWRILSTAILIALLVLVAIQKL
jgi:hypothetical protein